MFKRAALVRFFVEPLTLIKLTPLRLTTAVAETLRLPREPFVRCRCRTLQSFGDGTVAISEVRKVSL